MKHMTMKNLATRTRTCRRFDQTHRVKRADLLTALSQIRHRGH